MIIQGIFSVITGFVSFVLGLFPAVAVPDWMSTGVPGAISTVYGYLAGVSVWFPFDALGTALTFVVAALGAAVAIKGIRMLASFFTGGGGSAA